MILHVYSRTRLQEQQQTLEWIEQNTDLEIESIFTIDDYTYSNALINTFSAHKAFFTLEQDIVPSAELLWSMVFCSYPVCVSNYMLYPSSTLIDDTVFVNRNVVSSRDGKPLKLEWVDENADWCDFYGLGFTAFKDDGTLFDEIRKEFKPCHYGFVDHNISTITWSHNRKAHIHHEPIIHNHR